LKIKEEEDSVTLILFHSIIFKYLKCLRQLSYDKMSSRGSGKGWLTFEMRRAPFAGLQLILYLHAQTDWAQSIKVARE
jgi:hypothetical protein